MWREKEHYGWVTANHRNHKNDWICPFGSCSPTDLWPKQRKLSELIWTSTQTLLFLVKIGFISLSLSLCTSTWEIQKSTTCFKLLLLDVFNFKKILSSTCLVLTKPKAVSLSLNVVSCIPTSLEFSNVLIYIYFYNNIFYTSLYHTDFMVNLNFWLHLKLFISPL